MQSIPDDPSGRQSDVRIHPGTIREGIHSTLQIPIRIPLLFHQEKGWEITTRTRLSTPQCKHHQKPVPPSPHYRSHKQFCGGSHFYKIRHPLGIQQRTDQRRRRMESSVQNEVWVMGTNGDVFRPLQLPFHVPGNDGLDF